MPRNANQSKSSNYSIKSTNANVRINISSPAEVGITSSFSFWLKRTDNTVVSQPYKVVGNGLYGMYISSSAMYVRYGGAAITINNTATLNAIALTDWVHWVIIREEATSTTQDIRLYANGSLVYSLNGTSGLGTLDSKVDSLMYQLQATDFMNSFSIFDYALSPSQITTLYGDSANGVGNPMALPSTPIAYYPLGTSAYNGEYLAENNAIGDYVFDFSGGTDIISYSNINLTGNRTVSFWVNINSPLTSAVYLGSGGNDYYPYMTATSVLLRSSTQGASSITQPSIVTGKWYHYCITGDGTNATLYRDGILIGTLADKSLIINTIGGTPTGSSDINAKMSNVQIFNSALSATEVETLYNYGSPIRTLANIPQSSNLKAWYKLDASEVYNSSTTKWEVNDATSAYKNSLYFGDNQYNALTLNNIDFGSVNSISFWAKRGPNGYSSNDNVLGTNNGNTQVLFRFVSSSIPYMAFSGDGLNSGSVYFQNNVAPNYGLYPDTWSHFVLTRNGNTFGLYINKQDVSATSNFNQPSSNQTRNSILSTIGNRGTSVSASGESYISNVTVFNTVLGQSDVDSLYNNGVPLTDMSSFTSLVSWWKLNNLTTGIEDSKGSNNATNSGGAVTVGSVSTLNGTSSGMSQANLVQSDLQTVAPYSKYAMDFDSASSDYIQGSTLTNYDDGDFSVSIWLYRESGVLYGRVIGNSAATSRSGFDIYTINNNVAFTRRTPTKSAATGNVSISYNTWHNVVGTYNDSTGDIKLYLDGVLKITASATSSNNPYSSVQLAMGTTPTVPYSQFLSGKLSNASIWDTSLTSAQVTEIYNQGLPSNLNSHSAYSNLVSWWQLGENSSFASNWICADEKGSNNGDGQNMGVDALTNGVGTTANGVSSGMSEGNLVGDAPYSTANALSTNMVVTSRVSGSGNTP